MASLDLIKNIEIYKYVYLVSCLIIIYFLFKYDIFTNIPGFNFQGIIKNIGAVSLFLIFILIPFENINNIIALNIIKHITNYTGGVYYLHMIINDYLKKLLNNHTIYYPIIVYFISYFIKY